MSNGKLDNVAVKAVKDFNRIRREFQLSQAPTPPDPPKVSLNNKAAGQIELTWAYVVPNSAIKEDSFDIERREGTADFVVVGQAAVDARSHIDKPVVPGTTYQYRVRAIHITGDSVSTAIAGKAT